jgi:hypothetical protein
MTDETKIRDGEAALSRWFKGKTGRSLSRPLSVLQLLSVVSAKAAQARRE